MGFGGTTNFDIKITCTTINASVPKKTARRDGARKRRAEGDEEEPSTEEDESPAADDEPPAEECRDECCEPGSFLIHKKLKSFYWTKNVKKKF
jgi:hypothetical protein